MVIIDFEFIAAGCTGKEAFANFHLAFKVAKRRLGTWDKDYRGDPYKCRVCHLWHLGSAKAKTRHAPRPAAQGGSLRRSEDMMLAFADALEGRR